MSWFAQISNTNVVQQVVFVAATYSEKGEEWCSHNYGGIWKETDDACKFRKHFAIVGCTYNYLLDAFIHPQPFTSWVLDAATCNWSSPIPYPDDGNLYIWDSNIDGWRLKYV